MKISRVWAMPDKDTFSIKPIKELISRYFCAEELWADPFVGFNPFGEQCILTNDLNPAVAAHWHMESLEFLRQIPDGSVGGLFFDPPYSPRQITEMYQSVGLSVTMQTTQASFWGDRKKEVARVVKCGGVVISCGGNSGGVGKSLGFQIEEILLVPHGGWHNDTIVTVERKI